MPALLLLLLGLQLTWASPVGADDTPRRLAGDDRFTTSLVVAEALADRLETARAADRATVHLARGDGSFADAVAAGALDDGVLLLVRSCSIPRDLRDELVHLAPDRVVALGGPRAVCDDVLADARAITGATSTARVAGADRFATAVEIATLAYPRAAPATVYLARGDVLADALAAGTMPDGPVLLVPSCGGLPPSVRGVLVAWDPEVVVLGGPGAVCEATVDEVLVTTDGVVRRLAGADRTDTARLLAERYDALTPDGQALLVVNAYAEPDAVLAGQFGRGQAAILLVPPCGALTPPVREHLRGEVYARVTAVGGEAVVCDQVLADVAALARTR